MIDGVDYGPFKSPFTGEMVFTGAGFAVLNKDLPGNKQLSKGVLK